jgi:hypothetical protein
LVLVALPQQTGPILFSQAPQVPVAALVVYGIHLPVKPVVLVAVALPVAAVAQILPLARELLDKVITVGLAAQAMLPLAVAAVLALRERRER